MRQKSIRHIKNIKAIRGKKILYRADFNVPLVRGRIGDDFKIIQHLPTIRFLLRYGCSLIIVTHLGRPNGRVRHDLSVKPVALRLKKVLGRKIELIPYARGFQVGNLAARIKPGQILMLENIRFEAGEEKNDPKLARELASWADYMVMDAFGVCHRKQASVAAIKKYIKVYSGLLLDKEIEHLQRAQNPKHPSLFVVGGAKIATKARLIQKMKKSSDYILLGGGVANTFLAAAGYEIGKSLADRENVKLARKLKTAKIILPVDFIVATSKNAANSTIKKFDQIKKSDYIFDIGPKTIRLYSSFIKNSQTIIWNGPLGLFELKEFRHGTMAVARTMASRSSGRAFGLAGGGETIEALKITKMIDYIDWVSTGGGAMLSYLAKEKMPGLIGLV